jgi:hypothetical protein
VEARVGSEEFRKTTIPAAGSMSQFVFVPPCQTRWLVRTVGKEAWREKSSTHGGP